MLLIVNDLLGAFARTRHALVTVPAAYHKRPANVACRRISELNQLSKRSYRVVVIRNRGRVNCDRRRNKQLALLARQELQFKPAKDVIDNGLGEADFGIARPSAGLEAHVGKLAAQDFERDTMLEGERHRRCKRIHEPGDGRTLFRHGEENFSGETVVVDSDSKISLLAAYRKVMSKRPPLIR